MNPFIMMLSQTHEFRKSLFLTPLHGLQIKGSETHTRPVWMKNEVYYKQQQRAVSSQLAAVSSVQITLFDWLVEFGPEASNSTLRPL